jgi:hypothetical protein
MLMRLKKHSGLALATTAALLFGTASLGTAQAEEAKIACNGVNGCKGQSACKTAQNECKGMNACKGQGFVEMTKKECTAAQAKAKEEARR